TPKCQSPFSVFELGSWALLGRCGVAALGIDARVSNRRRHPLDDEGLDDVADLDVVELLEADAALEARLDLGHVVLEAAERADLPLVDDLAVAQQARLRVARPDDAPL